MKILEIDELPTLTVSAHVAAALLEYKNANYLSELVKEHGLPKNDYNTFPLLDIIIWNYRRKESLHKKEIERIRAEDTKGRLDTVNADLKDLELAEKRKELISVEVFNDALESETILFIKGLEHLSIKLKLQLNLSNDQQKIIDDEINNIRNKIADVPANIPGKDVDLS